MPMPWFLITFVLLNLRIPDVSEAAHEEKVPSALVVGTVFCDTCFQQEFSRTSHFTSGAYVSIECDSSSSPSFRQEVRTNKHGKFKFRLPPLMGKDAQRIEGCTVKLIKSSDPGCGSVSLGASSSLRLKSKRHGLHIFSAGLLAFKPLKQPSRCTEGHPPGDPKFGSKKYSIPSKSVLPPIPELTPPSFPFPFPSPPPLIPLPPIPWLTPPPPLIPLPPIPFLTPPPSPFIPLPPIPGLTPPPPPSFPFPIPPLLPLPPIPGFTPPSPSPPSFPFPPLPPLPPLPLIPFPPLPGFTPPPPPPPPPTPSFHFPPLPPIFPFPPPPDYPGKPPASTLPEKISP